MVAPKLIQSKPWLQTMLLGLVVGLATLFLATLLWGSQGTIPAHADHDTLYVDGTSGQDIDICGTITAPCQSISYTLNHRADDDNTILVAQGIYTENLIIHKGVTLIGGYESIGWTRSITLYETIIDGNRAGSVVVFKSSSDEAILDGFTITGGDAGDKDSGGGIVVQEASPTIANNTITDNTAGIAGGGIYVRNSSPQITHNTITGNMSGFGGGGIEIHTASPTIEDNIITLNTAPIQGGGIRVWNNSAPAIEGNAIIGNEAVHGGGILVEDNSSPLIKNNTITGNGDGWGGGIYVLFHSSPIIEDNTITDNTGHTGGGIYVALHSSPLIKSNTINDNTSQGDGGGINVWNNSSPTIEGNTITGNTAFQGGGIYVWEYSSPQVTDNAFEYNTAYVNGGAIWASYTSSILDQEGNPLHEPDTLNTYVGNVPDDIYLEPEPPSEPEPGPGRDLQVPQDYPTVQAAINAADDWDTVIVAPGTYTENINFNGKSITVRSENPEDLNTVQATIIDGGADGSVVTFESQETAAATLAGFTIRNGSGLYNGGGILCYDRSNPTIMNNVITGNMVVDGHGGGIGCWNSSPTIISNTITGNTAADGGAISCDHSCSATIRGNTIRDNVTSGEGFGGGGIVCTHSSPLIENNVISKNTASGGGGINLLYSSPTIVGNTIVENMAGVSGGGGGIMVDCCYASPLIEDNVIRGNRTEGGGGGIYQEHGPSEIRNNTIKENVASDGAGIKSNLYSSELIVDNVIEENCGDHGAGIIITEASNPTIVNNIVRGNTANYGGGGIGIINSSPFLLDNTISDNKATTGGGVFIGTFPEDCPFPAGPTLQNNVIVKNGALPQEGYLWGFGNDGGGVFIIDGSEVELLHNTIADDMASGEGGGAWIVRSTVSAVNTVLWGNDVFVDGLSTVSVLYSDVEQGWPGEGNISADPLFAAAANGDYHLRFGSPCIDTGMDVSLDTDFEGDLRPFDGDGDGIDKYDMGADEWVGTLLTPTSTPTTTPTATPTETPTPTSTPTATPTVTATPYRLYMPLILRQLP
jgi:parallel beta-helix repeat protein